MTRNGRGGKSLGLLGLVGAAATAWYFLDPRKGADRRERFATGARQMYGNTETSLRQFGTDASKTVSTAVDRAGELAREGFEKVSHLAHEAADGASRTVNRVTNRVDGADGSADGLNRAADKAADKARAVTASAGQAVTSAGKNVADAGRDISNAANKGNR